MSKKTAAGISDPGDEEDSLDRLLREAETEDDVLEKLLELCDRKEFEE